MGGKKRSEDQALRARLVLRKHSAVIQMENRVTGVQRKLWNLLLHHAREALKRQETAVFEIPLGELRRWVGMEATDKVKLKNALRALTKVQVEFNVLRKDGEHWGVFVLLPSVEIKPDGLVRYELTERVRKVLLRPRMYALLDLGILRGLRNKYAIALYELAKDYIGTQIPEMSVDEFKKLMGIPPGQYKRERNLKARVIAPAVREINQLTDLEISYAITREYRTRRWQSIRFTVRRKGEGIAPEDIVRAYELARKHFPCVGVSPFRKTQVLYFFCAADNPEYIASLIRVAAEGGIQNPVAFVRSKLRRPPADRLEPLLYLERLPIELQDAVLDAFAGIIELPRDWRNRVRPLAMPKDVVLGAIERLFESGLAKETLHGDKVRLYVLNESTEPDRENMAWDFAWRLLSQSVPNASVLRPPSEFSDRRPG